MEVCTCQRAHLASCSCLTGTKFKKSNSSQSHPRLESTIHSGTKCCRLGRSRFNTHLNDDVDDQQEGNTVRINHVHEPLRIISQSEEDLPCVFLLQHMQDANRSIMLFKLHFVLICLPVSGNSQSNPYFSEFKKLFHYICKGSAKA